MSSSDGASELFGAAEAVTSALTRQGITYFITGSFASSVQGEYRATNDVDLVVELDAAKLDTLLDQLSTDFVTDIDQARSALASGQSFNLIHRLSYLKVDIFPSLTEFDRQAARRADSITLTGAPSPLRVATVEDILLAKLRWYRLGGEESGVQRRDIQGLIALNKAEMDTAHLRRWASALGVADLLARFLP
jgi:predicted nucleotidyltransferase